MPSHRAGAPRSQPPWVQPLRAALASAPLWFMILGGLSLVAFGACAVLSWPLAAATPGGADSPFLGGVGWARGWFGSDREVFVAYCLPLLVPTACALLALVFIARQQVDRLASTGRWALIWSIAFAVVCLGAMNVLQSDSWVQVVWGRMIARGADPYVTAYSASDVAGLPVLQEVPLMSYGPIWAGVMGVLSLVTGGVGPVTWWLEKLVLCGAWIVILLCVRALARPLGPRREAVAIVLTGWLPVGVHEIVAEEHCDSLMVALLLVALVARRTWPGPLALAGSVLAKYTTAVLVPVTLLYEWRAGRAGLWRRVWPGALVLVAGAAFVLSGGRWRETASEQGWRFLDPAEALEVVGVPESVAVLVMRLVFGAVLIGAVVRLWRGPSLTELYATQLAMLTFFTFAYLAHVWPWYLVWLLPLAALVPGRGLSIFVLAAALVAPAANAFWFVYHSQQLVSAAMYVFAGLMLAAWVIGKRMLSRRATPLATVPASL